MGGGAEIFGSTAPAPLALSNRKESLGRCSGCHRYKTKQTRWGRIRARCL